jgi:FAD/FMN-containing dehydrogenase
MTKISEYLNEHILGEASSSDVLTSRYARGGGPLKITPELVVSPLVTNDMRKVVRFSWQLAEKGHVLPITVRGGGTDKSGASIGKGIIINTLAHLSNILAISTKAKDMYVHVQPGVTVASLLAVLKSHSMSIPISSDSPLISTLGGVIGNNRPIGSQQADQWVKRLEVVLSNGDIIETGRMNRHELNKKKGLQTFEGEIYRKIDGLIEDNKTLVSDKISVYKRDNTGYASLAKVKDKSGSFDLTPLFCGSQGTLGIVSEIVLKADFVGLDESIIVATFADSAIARSVADSITLLEPSRLVMIDGAMLDAVSASGKRYVVQGVGSSDAIKEVLFVAFDDERERQRNRKYKKALKLLSKFESKIYVDKNHSKEELEAVLSIGAMLLQTTSRHAVMPSIIEGAAIPSGHRGVFLDSLKDLAIKDRTELPTITDWLSGEVRSYPVFDLSQVADKQKIFKLINDYYELVARLDGDMCFSGAEGRLRTSAVHARMDEEVLAIFDQVKNIFDPFAILNAGVKQKTDLKTLISHLDVDFDGSEYAVYAPNR